MASSSSETATSTSPTRMQQRGRSQSEPINLKEINMSELTYQQAVALWNQYDTKKDGLLDGEEAIQLTTDLIMQISEQQSDLANAVASLFVEPGEMDHPKVGVETIADKKAKACAFAAELRGKLDEDKNGKVTKKNFLHTFGQWLSEKVKEEMSSVYFENYHSPYRTQVRKKMIPPTQMKMKISDIDFNKSTVVSQEVASQIWNQYDRNNDGVLDSSDIEEMSVEIVRKIADEKASVATMVGHMFESPGYALGEIPVEERDYVISVMNMMYSGLSVNASATRNELRNKLDLRRDRKITRDEFMKEFGKWLQSKITREMRGVYF